MNQPIDQCTQRSAPKMRAVRQRRGNSRSADSRLERAQVTSGVEEQRMTGSANLLIRTPGKTGCPLPLECHIVNRT